MVVQFRGSIPGLYVPLSTLHPRTRARRYMTRSQCGALLLHCMKLSFTTPYRLLPAHLNQELADLGHTTERATDGSEALLKLESTHPELVLVDYQMAGMNGIEV